MLHLSVAYDMNTKKHGIGHTQRREGDFKLFMYILSKSTTALQFCQKFGGTVVEEKILVLNVSQSELSPRTQTYYLIGRQ